MKRLHEIKASGRQQQTRVIQVAALAKHLKDLSVCRGLIVPSASPGWETPHPTSARDKTVTLDTHLTSVEFIDVEKCTSNCADVFFLTLNFWFAVFGERKRCRT